MIIFLVLLLLLLAVSYICYRMVFYVPDQNPEDVISVPDTEQYALYKNECVKMIKNVLDIPYEEVWIQADDGIRLLENTMKRLMVHHYKLCFTGTEVPGNGIFAVDCHVLLKEDTTFCW